MSLSTDVLLESSLNVCLLLTNICEFVQQVMYDIDGFALPFADQIRDLGVHYDCRLKYDKHICLGKIDRNFGD